MENTKRKKKTEDPGTDGWLTSKWLLQVLDGKAWVEFIWASMSTSSTRLRKQ